ncbi:MAG: enoyl-CoA hydratase/isomerase family protein [Elusimicrobia bacterium]|nr:enoyl-CoA hydratase/isomerase family protein [Elusimicrobiota bacterium]
MSAKDQDSAVRPGAVRVEVTAPVASVAFSGRGPGNIVSRSLMEDLVRELEALDQDAAVRCIVLAGSPTSFCSGVEVSELEQTAVLDPGRESYLECWDRVGKVAKPVVAAVSGPAIGAGFELALACDLIVAGESASFGFDQLDLGVIPGAGGTQRLARSVGRHRALDLLLTGRRLNGSEAMEFGLVARVWPDEVLVKHARLLARVIAEKAPLAVKAAKESVLEAEELDFEAGLVYERKLLGSLFSTADQKEGMKAFRDGRKPSFEGK